MSLSISACNRSDHLSKNLLWPEGSTKKDVSTREEMK